MVEAGSQLERQRQSGRSYSKSFRKKQGKKYKIVGAVIQLGYYCDTNKWDDKIISKNHFLSR